MSPSFLDWKRRIAPQMVKWHARWMERHAERCQTCRYHGVPCRAARELREDYQGYVALLPSSVISGAPEKER